MRFIAKCYTCDHSHTIEFDPVRGSGAAFADWMTKHPYHDIDFEWPERTGKRVQPADGFEHLLHNADVKLAYGTGAAYTITLASLASSTTLVAGQESDAISNTNKYLDFLVSGKVTTGTGPTASRTIEAWAIGSLDDVPNWPDVFDGTNSAETVTSRDILNAFGRPLVSILTASTNDQGYPWGPVSLAQQFGGIVPVSHSLWLTHSTGVALNATAGNHNAKYVPVYAMVT